MKTPIETTIYTFPLNKKLTSTIIAKETIPISIERNQIDTWSPIIFSGIIVIATVAQAFITHKQRKQNLWDKQLKIIEGFSRIIRACNQMIWAIERKGDIKKESGNKYIDITTSALTQTKFNTIVNGENLRTKGYKWDIFDDSQKTLPPYAIMAASFKDNILAMHHEMRPLANEFDLLFPKLNETDFYLLLQSIVNCMNLFNTPPQNKSQKAFDEALENLIIPIDEVSFFANNLMQKLKRTMYLNTWLSIIKTKVLTVPTKIVHLIQKKPLKKLNSKTLAEKIYKLKKEQLNKKKLTKRTEKIQKNRLQKIYEKIEKES